MIKVDLITGFLGSGKTTFLKLYTKYFLDQGLKVGILENDYGAVNVDMLLLNELRSDNCELEMVAGGCDAACHSRRFKTKLIAMGMSGYNRVIIEPSGIFDVDEFFDALREEPLDRWYEIGNVITIVDTRLENNLSDASDFFLASQIANAGSIILSRTQLTDQVQIYATIKHLKDACKKANLNKNIDNIIFTKNWQELTNLDFENISNCGYSMSSYVKKFGTDESEFETVYFLELPISLAAAKVKIKMMFEDESFGKVLRVKGFIKDTDKWYQINSTRNEMDIDEMNVGQEVFIVIGEKLNKDKIKNFMSAL